MIGRALLLAAAVALLGGADVAHAAVAAPPPLSADASPANDSSTYGSGHFGQWQLDEFGLPAFRYDLDEAHDARAQQPELGGGTGAQHQVGNDHIKGMAYNDGYTQFWSQDRLPQWANLYQAASQHFAGGWGYLNLDGRTLSTMYLDRPAGSTYQRQFGVGYMRRRMDAAGVSVSDAVYAPYGDDPVLAHDVTLRNTSSSVEHASWFEYWDVNPYYQTLGFQRNIGMDAPAWNPSTQTLSVAQNGTHEADNAPLSIFAAQVRGSTADYDTSVKAFFGAGTRAAPTAVAVGKLADTMAGATSDGQAGDVLFAMRTPVTLAPGQSVTLRYVYGMAHPTQIAGLVSSYRAAADPFAASERAWAGWLPRADFGAGFAWVSRELTWDAYLLRSASVYEEVCGHHTITQGGYYQYADGANLGYRSWLHYELPMVYSDPEMAREILRYSIGLQPPPPAAQNPYGMGPLCNRVDLGTSNDLDFWLLLAAGEYGLGSRDTHFFDEKIPYYDTQGADVATAWQHIKDAFAHQESLRGPHGDYVMGSTGDWSDFSTQFEQMTESTLVTAQLAYAYPKLAQLAALRGDAAFAAALRAAAAADMATLRADWTGGGWYARGWSGARQVGSGVIFEEPQPWAILAGVPSASQATALVANIRRYLDGVGAPASLGGPARFGTTQIPAYADPGISERGPTPGDSAGVLPQLIGTLLPNSPWQGAAEWPGGVWFDLNGWLTWAYASLDGVVPGTRGLAWDEYTRNTLANHATLWPDHWDGTISIDDVCYGFYSAHPSWCGNGLGTSYEGQITEQPTWMVMNAIRLAGVTPLQDGYQVTPHLPMTSFSLRLPDVGVASSPGVLRGYQRVEQSGVVRMHVAAPAGVAADRAVAFADGRQVPSTVSGGLVVFSLATQAGRAADWAVVGPGGGSRAGGSPGRPAVRCASRRDFVIRLVAPRGRRLVRATVFVNGRRVRVVSGRRLRAPVDLRGLPKGTVRVRIDAVARGGRRTVQTRTYHTCVARRRGTTRPPKTVRPRGKRKRGRRG